MRWAGYVASTRDRRYTYRVMVGIPEKDPLENTGLDEKLTLKGVFKKWDEEKWTVLIWLRTGRGGGRL